MTTVAELYNNLFKLNTKRKEKNSYPIHKKLNYQDKNIDNLYSYLLKNYDIPEHGKLLDCGCGVGYGIHLLANEKPKLQLHGISLSKAEIELAKKVTIEKGLDDRCHFELKSFDDVKPEEYDCVIAIESLKHSPNISYTMDKLLKSLRSDGQFFIIEDVGKTLVNNFAARRQCKDWALQRIFTLQDYQDTNHLTDKKIEHLNKQLKTPSYLSVLLRIFAAEIMTLAEKAGLIKKKGAQIIRGGFYQEYLYATDQLDYLILSGRKK